MKDYTRHAIWLIVAYLVLLTAGTIASVQGLWEANEANYNVIQARTKDSVKLPCSSEINEDCAIYIK